MTIFDGNQPRREATTAEPVPRKSHARAGEVNARFLPACSRRSAIAVANFLARLDGVHAGV
jgi:hypothetical protein